MDKGSIGVDTAGFSLALKPPGPVGPFFAPGPEMPPMSMATAMASPPAERRINEMDFFSEERKASAAAEAKGKAQPPFSVKSEDLTINTGLRLLTTNAGSDESTVDDCVSRNEEDKDGKCELETMQKDLEEMMRENHRLRGVLSQVTANYNALQMQLLALMRQRGGDGRDPQPDAGKAAADAREPAGAIVPRQFMDLGPAAESEEPSNSSTDVGSPRQSGSPGASMEYHLPAARGVPFDIAKVAGEVAGLDREGSPSWITSKLPKLTPTRNPTATAASEQAQEATMRKARVSVRARSEAPMITDGCQWRKYGQKMAKGNPCPRAYYRCTMAAGCPVRKQVQRCAEDRSILITTYEGNHNHPLPPAAMAMASTTSAAASMLLSGSMPSADGGLMNPNFLARTLLPCSSNMATISASAPFPTVTLDLTHAPTPLQQYPRPPVGSQLPNPFTSAVPQLFGQALYNQSKFSGLQSSSSTTHESVALPSGSGYASSPPQTSLADTVSAATAAITADPNFTAMLAAAITSFIGGAGGGGGSSQQPTINASTASTTNNSNSNAD